MVKCAFGTEAESQVCQEMCNYDQHTAIYTLPIEDKHLL